MGNPTKKETTMTKKKRRHYDASFKSRVALEAIFEGIVLLSSRWIKRPGLEADEKDG